MWEMQSEREEGGHLSKRTSRIDDRSQSELGLVTAIWEQS